MMKFYADISPLDIECSILDIHHLVCQTPRDPAGGDRRGARFERTSRGSIRGVPRGYKNGSS
ncbi:MAG: hypothetical protein NTV22_05130, partial [bacterium]|nr:hypothetical protein [bacterium]